MTVHVEPIAPDEAAIRQFFEILHEAAGIACAGMPDPGMLQLSRVHPADGKLQVVGRFPIGDVESMAAQAIADGMGGFNSYVEGRTVRADLPRTERGKLLDTVAVFALVVDADADKGRDGVLPDDVEPSLCVSSSPGNRHDWLFLSQALPAGEAQAIGAALRMTTGADDDTGNPTQPYRVAGTPNFPGAKKMARGRVVSPTSILTEGRSYDPDELRRLFPTMSSPPALAVERVGDPVPQNHPQRTVDELLASLSPKRRDDLAATDAPDRSAHFFKVTGWLKSDGYTLTEATEIWVQFIDGVGREKYKGRLAYEVWRAWHRVSDEPDAGAIGAEAAARMQAAASSSTIAAAPVSRRGRLLSLEEDTPYVHEPELIRDTLPERGTAIVAGQSGAGKTFLALDLSMKIMTGEPFAGRKIERPGGVLYLAAEGEGTIAGRMKAARSRLSDPSRRLPFMLMDRFGPIDSAGAYKALLVEIQEAQRQMRERFDVPLCAFILDTLSAFQMIPEDKENDPAAWSKVFDGLGMISDETGALAIPVHHYGKTAAAGLRGSSNARAETDAILALTCDRDEITGDVSNRLLALTKSRNAPEGCIGPVALKPVIIGQRHDGSDVTSLVVEIDAGTKIVSTKLAKKSQAERIFGDAFSAAFIDHAQSVHVHGDAAAPIVRAVDLIRVRDEFDRRYVASAEDEKKRRETVRKQLKTGLLRSVERGSVCSGSWAGIEWVWPATKAGEVDLSGILSSIRQGRSGTE